VLSFLTECDTKQSDNNTTEISIQPPLTQIQNKFTGEWKHDNTIWYTSELTIQDNGTFKFHNQGCYGKNFTEGQWTNNNGTIILSSFISFKRIPASKYLLL
jgi:hypothetical protein